MATVESLGSLLKRLREALELSQAREAELLCEVSGKSTVTRHEVSRWERGERTPTEWLPYLARVLQVDLTVLESATQGDRASFSHDDSIEEDEDDVNRRTLLALLGAATTLPFTQQVEAIRGAFNGSLSAPPTGRDVDAWERVAFDYAHEVGALPSEQVLPDLLCDFAEINGLIASAPAAVRPGLLHCGAQLATLVAIAMTNLGDSRGARRWWRSAARAADESGNHYAAALVRGRQAVFSLYEARPAASILSTAEEAIVVASGKPCAGVASGYAAKAQVLAQLGQRDEAVTALHDLTDVFELLPEQVREDRSSQWGWGLQRLHHVTSHVHTFAGDLEKAARAQDAALRLYPPGNYQGRSQIELHRAGCLVRAGDVSEGVNHLLTTMRALPRQQRNDGLLRRTAVSTLSLAPPGATGHPAMMEARELLALTPGDR